MSAEDAAVILVALVGCRHLCEMLAARLLQHGLLPVVVCAHEDFRRPEADSGVPSIEHRDVIKAELRQAGI